jgi:hypothetical protein
MNSSQEVEAQWWQWESEMKNYFSKLVALALFAMALMGAALAQDVTHAVRANIPFSFYAGRQMLPAGEYTISINMEDHLAIIGQKATGRSSFLPGLPDDSSRDERTVLIFKLGEGEVYALREVRGPDLAVSFNAKEPRATMKVQNRSNESVTILAYAK